MRNDDDKKLDDTPQGPPERLQGIDGKFIEKPFNWKVVDFACSQGCSAREVAGLLDLSQDTVERKILDKYGMTFGEYKEYRMAGQKLKLRNSMWKAALGGNITAQIWLSKNELGMSDKISQEVTATQKTIQFSYTIAGNKYTKKPDIEVKPIAKGVADENSRPNNG